ncbi:winged helix-turn-helix domain-containing protein [Nonomuraea sp. NPDC049504]|uniref:GntR family transcriptional regulator n=1 Tax=Nonomuraea sp. NPDC049504 TaxID=3154729 RepID=UPI00344802D6
MTRKGPRGPVPIYQMIINAIREDIDAGRLQSGQELPTEAELCKLHGASRLTVRKALAVLRDEGLIYTIQARGSYVGPEDAPTIRTPWPFEQVAASLLEGIKKGGYQPDEVLPSEVEITQTYGVAKKTARAAVALLREQGWVYTVPAIGTFVSSRDKWPTSESG